MKAKIFKGIILAAILFIAVTGRIAHAQLDQGQIIGTVIDKTNAPIKGASVEAIDERTGESRKTTTNDDGSYQILALKPSVYTIRVAMDQFAPAEVKQVELTVGAEVRRNFTLQVASLSSAVTVVESVESAIDTTSAAIGVNVNLREVTELPLNGRQVSQLFLQSPGSTNSGDGTFGVIRFSGRSFEQNAVRYDGMDGGAVISNEPGVLNDEINTPFRLQASLENVQEFRVESNNYPAEYGTGTGGQVSIITKSGSNSFHGSAYEYFRNDYLDAKNFFDVGAKKSELRLNQFGGSLGGPIAKDKLFFFAYYEGYRLRAGINNIESVPSAAVRSLPVCTPAQTKPGFGGTSNNCVKDTNIQGLLTANNGFPGSSIFIGPGAFQLKDSNGNSVSGDPAFDIYQLNGLTTVGENSGGLRLDYHLNNKHTLYARYFRDQGNWQFPEGVTGRKINVIDNPQNAVLSLQSVFSNSLINEAKAGFNEALSRIAGAAPTVTGLTGVDLNTVAINLSGSVANTGIAGQGSSTGVATPGGLVRSNSASNGQAQPYTPYEISFIDNVSYLAGKHSLKFGAEVRVLRLYTDRIGGSTYTYSNLNSFLGNSLTSLAYLSPVSGPSPFNGGATGNLLLKQQYYIGYAEDEFRIRPNLTLNYGLRYEFYSPLYEDRNRYILFNTNTGVLSSSQYCQLPLLDEYTGSPNPAAVAAIPPGACQGNRPWYHADPAQFGPRIGIAWSPSSSSKGLFGGEHTVFRGGFGIVHGPGQPEAVLQPAESDRVWTSLTSFPDAVFHSGGVGNYCGTDPSCATSPSQITTFFINNGNSRQAQVRAYAPEYTVGEHVFQYTGSWQQQWGYQLVSTIAYVGSQGRNLFLRNVANRIVSVSPTGTVTRQFSIVNPTTGAVSNPYAEIDYKTSGGHDSYNALQTQLVRRASNGLTLSAQYTFAKSFGNSSGSKDVLTTGDPFDFDYDLGYNTFDIRHAFNLSALYDLPIGRKKQYLSGMNGFADAVFGNWELGTIVSARSGLPIDIRIVRPDFLWAGDPGNPAEVGKFFSSKAANRVAVINTPGGGNSRNVRRPDLVPGVNPFLPNGYLNPAAFTTPAPGTFGNLQRGFLHGPKDVQADITIAKKFPLLREATNLEFRAEFYNIFNHPNFANPPSTISPSYGSGITPGTPFTSPSAGGGGVFGKFNQTVSTTVGTGTNRQIQIAMRLNF